jgi:hypothetical protein
MYEEDQSTAASPTPSVKGSVFLMSVQGVKRLMTEGRLSREEVEFDLHRDDIRFLEEKILPAGWYPVEAFDRFASISLDVLADGDPAYLAGQGEDAASRILGSQAYQGFIDSAKSARQSSRARSSVLTMAQLMLSFSRWELDSETAGGRRFEIRVTEAGDMPESLRYAAQGFIQHLAAIVADEPCTVSSERLDQDTILFRGRTRS